MNQNSTDFSWPGWQTVRRIGEGSFGAVYEIERSLLGDVEKAALKVISIPRNPDQIEEMRAEGYDDPSITDTFQEYLKGIVNEYSMMKKMGSCGNVVKCDDVRFIQQDNGFGWDIYIRMELLTPLLQIPQDTISEETVIQLGMDLCKALMECGKHNIIHRDIKPQNIFLSPSGSFQLGDFGVAKTVEKTMGGTRIGTLRYMAPEVFFNQPYGASADLYSLGLVMYWMLNERRLPFSPLPPEKLTAQNQEDANWKRLTLPQLPPPKNGREELKQIILKACSRKPDDRYSSAEEMYAQLQGLLSPWNVPVRNTATEHTNDVPPTIRLRPELRPEPAPAPAPSGGQKKRKTPIAIGAILLSLLLLLPLLALFLPREAVPVQDDPAIHRYSYHVENCSWTEAYTRALEKGGYLVRINSREELDHIVAALDANGYEQINFHLGGRRNLDSREFYWVDEHNSFIGEVLNAEDAWCSNVWFAGEPTFEFSGNTECYMQMYKDAESGWVWNDVIEDTILLDRNRSGYIGYIVEYAP